MSSAIKVKVHAKIIIKLEGFIFMGLIISSLICTAYATNNIFIMLENKLSLMLILMILMILLMLIKLLNFLPLRL